MHACSQVSGLPDCHRVQELRGLREKIKTKMFGCLTELRNMQALEDLLEKSKVLVQLKPHFVVQTARTLQC